MVGFTKILGFCKSLGKIFLPFLDTSGAFGTNQFAYRRKHSFMDALLWNVMSWITAFAKHMKVAIYCSDVSGAFDRVSSVLLMHALASKGLHSKILKVIDSWLQPRCAFVIVGSSKSHQLLLSNMVFQGTVLGPPLWNVFSKVIGMQ